MNLWKDILDSKHGETQTVEGMEQAARSLGYQFFVHQGNIYELKLSVGGTPSAEKTGRTVEDCTSPEVWAIASADERSYACLPNTDQPLLLVDLPTAVRLAAANGGKVGPWWSIYHQTRRAPAETNRIIVPR